MTINNRVFIKTTVSIIASTIGAGIFGLPYAFAHAGVMIGLLWLLLLALSTIGINLLMGEVALKSSDNYRFIGIAKSILNHREYRLTQLLTMISYFGTQVAYIILGGKFLTTILVQFFPITAGLGVIIYFLISSLIMFYGLKFIQKIDLVIVIFLFILIAVLLVFAAPHLVVANLLTVNLSDFFMPYGITLFALTSVSAITTIESNLRGTEKQVLLKSIVLAGIIAALITGLFGVVIAGVGGLATTQDAVSGLAISVGNSIMIIGSIIGLTAVLGVHTMYGNTLREILTVDYKLPDLVGWLAVILLPMSLVMISNLNFVKVLSIIGGVFGGLLGVMIARMYLKKFNRSNSPFGRSVAYVLLAVYFLGAVYELIYNLI